MRILWAGMVFFAATALAGRSLELSAESKIAAGPFLEEIRGNFSLEEVLASSAWKPLAAAPNYGFTDDVIWLRLRVVTPADSARVLFVDAWMKDLEVTSVFAGNRKSIDLGHSARFTDAPNRFRRIMLPFTFPAGETTLLFRLKGEDTVRFPLQIWKPASFQRFRDATTVLFAAYFGAMMIMILYNLFIYVSTRERSYLAYVAYVAAGLLYFSGQSGFVMQFSHLGPRYVLIHLVMAGLYIATLAAFTVSFLQLWHTHRILSRVLALAGAAGLAASAAALLPGVRFGSVAVVQAYSALVLLPFTMFAAVVRWREGYAPARFFVLAFALFTAGAVLFLFGVLGVLPFNLLTGQGIMIGSVAEIALLSLALSDRINFFKKSIEQNVEALQAARLDIEAAEKKYRSLVDDSEDMIFTLDRAGVITTMNPGSFGLLGLRPRTLAGRPFTSLIHDAHGSAGLQGAILSESMKNLERGPAQFRMLLSSSLDEPVELLMRMEQIGTGEDAFILCKASPAEEDSLLRFLNLERGEYELDNYLVNLEILNQRMTRNLARYFSAGESVLLQTCLREILMNAVEHGNLRVNKQEKAAAQKAGRYLDFLLAALRNPEAQARTIRVRYTINSERAYFQVTDQGPGFDYEAWMNRAKEGADAAGGRGLAMAATFFDVVRFSNEGRTVSLIKYSGGLQ